MGNEEGTETSGKQIDSVTFAAQRKMEAMGKNPDFATALLSADTVEEVTGRAIELDIPADGPQIIEIAYRAIGDASSDFRAEVTQNISDAVKALSVPADLPEWFLANDTGLPGYGLGKHRGEVDQETRGKFVDIALAVMFRSVQDYLRA